MRSSYRIFLIGVFLIFSVAVAGCMTIPSDEQVAEETRPVPLPDQMPSGTWGGEPMDEPLIAGYGDTLCEITVSGIIRGHQAERLIREANIFNPSPDAGNECILINVTMRRLTGSHPLGTPPHDFHLRGGDEDYRNVFARMPPTHPHYPDSISSPEDEVSGWLLFEVPSGRDLTLVWSPLGDPAGYIHLGRGGGDDLAERIPGPILSPRTPFIYMDARKSNELSIMYQYSTFRSSFTYESDQGLVSQSARDGRKYLLACLQVTHRGNHDGRYYLAEIPRVSAFTLYGPETIYTPVEMPGRRSDHISVGELYTETILERKENKQGFLLFEVPDDFTLQGAYLGVIPLKETGEVFWTL